MPTKVRHIFEFPSAGQGKTELWIDLADNTIKQRSEWSGQDNTLEFEERTDLSDFLAFCAAEKERLKL